MGLLDKIAGGIKDVVSDIGDKFDEAKTGGADWWYGENSVLDDMFDPLEKVTGFNIDQKEMIKILTDLGFKIKKITKH